MGLLPGAEGGLSCSAAPPEPPTLLELHCPRATATSTLQEPGSNSLTADNLEKFGKLNHSPGVPEDGALLSEAKLQSIISFLDEMEKSEQERPRSATSATQREVSAGLCWGGGPHWGGPLPLPKFYMVSTFPYLCFPYPRGSCLKRSWHTWSRRPLLPQRSRAPS